MEVRVAQAIFTKAIPIEVELLLGCSPEISFQIKFHL